MKRKAAEAPDVACRVSPEANGEIARMVGGLGELERQSGWDPYEVWRTRVKGSPAVMQEHERDPRGRAGLSSQGAPRQLARSADPTASGSGHLL